jgi:hypothetical protein
MIDPTPIHPDTFWKLTGTAWTAISSLIAAFSVIALIVFNWRFLRSAHEQGEAAKVQAGIASLSLQALQGQILEEQQIQRHAALAVIQHILTQIDFWRDHSKIEIRFTENRVYLLPDDWNVLVSYVSRHISDSVGKTKGVSSDLREAENHLNHILQTPFNQRSPNSSFQVIMQDFLKRLDQVKAKLEILERDLASQDPVFKGKAHCA